MDSTVIATALGIMLSIIVLIVYFVMASNVGKIKEHFAQNGLLKGEKYIELAKIEKYVGNNDKAREYLLRARYYFENSNSKGTIIDNKFLNLVEVINYINQKLSEL